MDNKDIILDVKKLNTSFVSDKKETKIIKDVSFQVKRGKTLAIVGESGCGKSVTVHSIVKLMPRNARVRAEKVQYNALKDGAVTEYSLDKMEAYGKGGLRQRDAKAARSGDWHGFSGPHVFSESGLPGGRPGGGRAD